MEINTYDWIMSDGYWIMPNKVLFDKNISDKQKLLYCLISSLCAEKGYCWASNDYLAEKIWYNKKNMYRLLQWLISEWYVSIVANKEIGNQRRIYINSIHTKEDTIHKNEDTPILKNVDHNNINNNNTINNISSSSDSNESSSEVLTKSNLLNSNNVLGDNDYTAQFDIFWKIYPHARKWKKQDAKKYFMQQDTKSVMENVKLYKWKIELWIEDVKYVPACERWIRDFVPVNNVVKEQDLYKIICKHMQMDNKKERYTELKNDFGTEKMDELVRKYNSNKKPTLYFN